MPKINSAGQPSYAGGEAEGVVTNAVGEQFDLADQGQSVDEPVEQESADDANEAQPDRHNASDDKPTPQNQTPGYDTKHTPAKKAAPKK